ncbi:hypothetical protein D3C75_1082270 [compost metagenome]
MAFEIADPVIVVNGAVFLHCIYRAKTVLHHHHWDLVTVVDVVQGPAEALRINLPLPGAGFQIRILQAHGQIAADFFLFRICTYAGRGIIAARIEIDPAFPQNALIVLSHLQLNPFIGKISFGEARIGPPHLNIGAQEVR